MDIVDLLQWPAMLTTVAVGPARPRLCAGRPAVLPRSDQYPRRLQERM